MIRPFPHSLCHGCVHVRLVSTRRGAVFIQCMHRDLPKYQSQPIGACKGFAPAVDKPHES